MFFRTRAMRGRMWAIAAILLMAAGVGVSAQECSVTIDSVAGAWYDNGTPLLLTAPAAAQTIQMRYTLTCDDPAWTCGFNVTNTYLVFSPDGADWGYAQAVICPDLTTFCWTGVFLNHFNKTGGTGNWGAVHSIGAGNVSGSDSIAVLFAFSVFFCPCGLHSGDDVVAVGIRIRPAGGSEGKHICVDTASSVPGGYWGWSSIALGHPNIKPSWYPEPQCFEVIGCCFGESIGNIDMSPDGLVTMGDLTVLIDHLFISLTPLACPTAANVDQSPDGLITMGDMTVLIDHLFIYLSTLPSCQ
jgi:hypothetical protein